MGEIRILSLDAGGMYGIVSLAPLIYLENKLKASILDHFHLCAATSASAITLAGICSTKDGQIYSAEEVLIKYVENSMAIFKNPKEQQFTSGNGFLSPVFSSTARDHIFSETYKDILLSDIRDDILIPTQELSNGDTYSFKTWKARADKKGEHNFKLSDVVRAATSAPSYFHIPEIFDKTGKPHHLMDGGTYAHNPSICAVSAARSLYHKSHEMNVLSLGVKMNNCNVNPKKARGRGKLFWASRIYNYTAQAQSNMAILNLEKNPRINFKRIEIDLNEVDLQSSKVGLDFTNASETQIRKLLNASNVLVKKQKYALDEIVEHLQSSIDKKEMRYKPAL